MAVTGLLTGELSMKEIIISAVVAAAVSAALTLSLTRTGPDVHDASGSTHEAHIASAVEAAGAAGLSLSVTEALPEDVWVNGARQPGDDHRILTSAENSVCYITKVEISGVTGPDDTAACSMEVDDFVGFWDLVVTVPEGSQSNLRCNARCLTWE